MLNKIILILICGIVAIFVIGQAAASLPNFSIPHFEGSQSNTVDLTKLSAAFVSAQGLSAGESNLEGIDVTQNQRSMKFIPGWVAGSCATLENGKAKVTYHSDTKTMPPSIVQGTDGSITLKIADPTVRSVGITQFDSKAIHNNRWCGLILKQFPDIQAMNRVVQKSACDWAKTDTSQLEARRADVRATATQLIQTVGVTTPVNVEFQTVPMTLPGECGGL